jgi:hypothetical protein
VNGQCSASSGGGQSFCSDGSTPVNGKCQNGSNPSLNCPSGSTPYNGFCYGVCPNGAAAVNGFCPAPMGTCPNGASPVNGSCSVGTSCDPTTDPNQCKGNNQGNAGGGDTCNAPPFCSGDPIMCNVLAQQWATRCAVERLSGTGTPPSDSDYGPTVNPGDVWQQGDGTGNGNGLDDSGFGLGSGGGDCPSMPSVTFMDKSFSVGDWVPCSALRILAMMILLAGYVQAAYIIGRA